MCKFGVFFKIISLFIIFCGVFCFTVTCAPSVSAKSAILLNADTGIVLFEHNADVKRGMASTTKIMTAIIAIESGKLDEKYTIPVEAVGIEGSSLYLKGNETMSLRDLVTGLMLRSANDAAEAIAIILAGNVESFSELMNTKAKEIGLTNSNFENPHGLASDNHYTTAKDLATLSAYAVKNPTFRSICSMHSATISSNEQTRTVSNHNKLLSIYDGAYGVKTGFTKATGRCLVSAAERDNMNLVAVTLDAPNDWEDHRRMLDYGFSNFELVNLANEGDIVDKLSLLNGTAENVPVYVKQSLFVCLSKNHSSIVERIELNRPRFAPIYKGDTVGQISYVLNGKTIASSALCAAEYVGNTPKNKSFLYKLFKIG